MFPSFLSPVSLYNSYLRYCFSSAGLTSQTLTLSVDGHDTTFHFWGPGTHRGGGEKPALVLIHGFGPVASWQWRRQVQCFASRFDVFVPDLLFFGESTTASADRTEVFQAAAVAALMERVGVERYSLVGTSYGGMVAYNVAKAWPERVEKVVIASSGINMRQSNHAKLLQRAGVDKIEDLMLPGSAAQMRKLLGLVLRYPPAVLPDFILNDIVNKLYGGKRKEKIELLKGLTIGQDEEPKISPLDKEVLVIWGDHDMIFPIDMATELKKLLGNKVRVEVMKNTGHIPQIEKPTLFNELVIKFLSESSKL